MFLTNNLPSAGSAQIDKDFDKIRILDVSYPAVGGKEYSITPAALGSIVGAINKVDAVGSSTDNAIVRFDGVYGNTLQNSGITIDDNGNLDLGGAEIRNLSEQGVSAVSTGDSYNIDWTAATDFELILTGSPTTFTFTNLAPRRAITLILEQGSAGSRLATWPSAIGWGDAGAPLLSTPSGLTDVITLITRSDGSTVYGFLAGTGF